MIALFNLFLQSYVFLFLFIFPLPSMLWCWLSPNIWFLLRYLYVKIPCYRYVLTVYADWLRGSRNCTVFSERGSSFWHVSRQALSQLVPKAYQDPALCLLLLEVLGPLLYGRWECAPWLPAAMPGEEGDARGLPSCSRLGGSPRLPPPGFPPSWSGVPLRFLAKSPHLHPGLQFLSL